MTSARKTNGLTLGARGVRLLGTLLVLGGLVGCGPNFRATLTAPEQGSAFDRECNVSGPWESNDRPHVNATVVADCASSGPIHVVVRTEDGKLLVQGEVAAVLTPDQPASLQTPAFTWPPQAHGGIVVELSGACDKGTLSTSAACSLGKDPPVAGAIKDPPNAGVTKDPPGAGVTQAPSTTSAPGSK